MAAWISLLVAIAAVSPFFFLGTASGHDIAFHMASWLDAAGQWKEGIWLPRWAEWPNYGFGEPRFIFYPPLSWLFGALLGSLLPWEPVAGVFFVCAQTLAGLSAHALLKRLTELRWPPLFGAACFAANPYALVIIYTRSDFAELLAIAFFPLLLLTALRLCEMMKEKRPAGLWEILAFALSFCAIWLSNAPAAVIATYSAAFVFAFASLQKRSLALALRGAAGMTTGFALAGFYLIPAIYEQRWVNIGSALAGGLSPGGNFLYARTSDAEHDAFNRVVSNIAVAILLWVVCAAALAWRKRQREGSGAELFQWLPVSCALCACVMLLVTPLSSPLWRLAPELRFVQFPWRWTSVAAVCAVALMTVSARGKLAWLWLAGMLVLIFGSGWYLVKNTWWDTEDMPTLEAAQQSGSGFEGTDEYDSKGDDHTDLPQKEPRARFVSQTSEASHGRGAIFVDEWTAEHRLLRVVTGRPEQVALRILDYPAWEVLVNGTIAKARHPEGTRQMIVAVPAGQSRIDIRFGRTADRTLGGGLSILSFLGSASALFLRKRSLPEAAA